MKKILLLFTLLIRCFLGFASGIDTLTIHEGEAKYISKQYFEQLNDRGARLTINDVLRSDKFFSSSASMPTLRQTNTVIWLKIILKNKTSQPFIPLTINTSVIDNFDLFFVNDASKEVIHQSNGSIGKASSGKSIHGESTKINCTILPDSTQTVFLRIKSSALTVLPIRAYSADEFTHIQAVENITIGAFMGIIIIMALYNLMLFAIVKDISYVYYVLYIVFLGLTQAMLRGYATNILTDDKSIINNYIIPITRIFFGYSVLLFVYNFLQLKQNLKTGYKYYYILFVIYTLPFAALFSGRISTAYTLISFSAFIVVVTLLIIGSRLYFRGFKPAKYFMLAWSVFLVAILISIGRNQGIVSYNNFTANIVPYSSVIELILFSVALADKINFYRRLRNESHKLALSIAKENERLITEHNISLEHKVKNRTEELIKTNDDLLETIRNLKAAQMQLIEAEKMASLGQLTAGVAHEINNPINFVSSNVKPLKLDFNELFTLLDKYSLLESDPHSEAVWNDIKQYKTQINPEFIRTEIINLLEGIEEGASRTSDIVQSLRTFSSTDDVSLVLLDINKAVLNTLVILRSTIPNYIVIKPVFDKLPLLNCYPGKVNQLLLNLINNAIQAITEKKEYTQESITIITKDYPENITIEVTDTGIGMSEATKQRIFEPFFTTKDIGAGTGLGLSIVFGIVEKHNGAIDVQTTPGKGTTFKVMLPKTLS